MTDNSIGRGLRWLRKSKRKIGRRFLRINEQEIRQALGKLDRIETEILFVHSSLSAFGWIRSGAAGIIDALIEWLGPDKTLALPTHSYCYPDENGQCEIFDPLQTPSQVGAITNYFWRRIGVSRSLHPTHSLAALGPDQNELVSGHENCDTPCGRETPYQKMLDRDASVLMFGATMNTYTLFHTTEDALEVPYLYESVPYELLVKGSDSQIQSVHMKRQDMRVKRRFQQMDSWLEERKALIRRPLGSGEILFIPSSQRVHELLAREMRQDPYFLVAQDARPSMSSVY